MACLKKRKTSTDSFVWYVQFEFEGRTVRKSLGTTSKTIAQRALNKYRVMEDEGKLGLIVNQKKPISLGDFLETHLKHAEQTLSPIWYYNKVQFFKNHITPFSGANTLLKNITKVKIEDYRIERLNTVTNRTVNIEVNCLMTLLRHAVDRDELEEKYIPKIKKMPEIKGRVRNLEISEVRALREAAHMHSPEMEAYVCLMLYAGLRSGEALHIRWEDFDETRRLLHVVPREDWMPKTKMYRMVPVPEGLQNLLASRKTTMPDALWIVEGKHTPYVLKRSFASVAKEAGLDTTGENKVTAHTLRHTFASHLVMKGTPLYTVSALLGHTTKKTTQIYAHLAQDHLQKAANEVEY